MRLSVRSVHTQLELCNHLGLLLHPTTRKFEIRVAFSTKDAKKSAIHFRHVSSATNHDLNALDSSRVKSHPDRFILPLCATLASHALSYQIWLFCGMLGL